MAKQKHHKLLLKYFLPFGAMAKVGPVVYKLELLADNRRHDVFHVLKRLWRILTSCCQRITNLPSICDSKVLPTPHPILCTRINRRNRSGKSTGPDILMKMPFGNWLTTSKKIVQSLGLRTSSKPRSGSDVDAFVGDNNRERTRQPNQIFVFKD